MLPDGVNFLYYKLRLADLTEFMGLEQCLQRYRYAKIEIEKNLNIDWLIELGMNSYNSSFSNNMMGSPLSSM